MPLKFKCPTGHELTVPSNWGGRVMRCPVCNEPTVVPNDRPAMPPPLRSGRRQIRQRRTPPRDTAPSAATPAAAPNRSRVARMLDEGVFRKLEPARDSVPKPPPMRGVAAERRHVISTYWLAMLMATVALFAAAPAVGQFHMGHDSQLGRTPQWVWMMLFIAALQLVYLAWMAMVPDWSTIRSVMWVFAAAAVAYAAGMAILMFTPPGQFEGLALGLSSDPVVRSRALGWSSAAVLSTSIACYLAGLLSQRWHKAYRSKLEMLRY